MHIPVLLKEVLKYLDPKSGQNFVDCTFGFGGHSEAILEKINPDGKVLGIEWDTEKFPISNFQFSKDRLILVNDSYTNLKEIIKREKFGPVNGILLDLGISSFEVDDSGRGFSFQKNEPLDMRFSQAQSLTAKEIINQWSEEELARIFQEYGQERFARNIASNIVEVRLQQQIETTFQLVEIIRKSFPRSYKFGKAHFATRAFQALRIAVNEELDNLKKVLPQALEVLERDGKIAVISFHSLEDAIVKKFFKEQAKNNKLEILTKKPIIASMQEVKRNPKARSAKLRVAVSITSIFIVCLFGLYFYQIQELVKSSYLLSNAQKDLLKFETQNLLFSQQNIETSSFSKIEELVLALDFVKNDSIKYIPLSNDYLVRK